MITKAEILAVADELELLPTTVEKDYVLGWVLFAVANQESFSSWNFKGGTCLKKCYFDTYRFSEDLDFTIPRQSAYDTGSIRRSLEEAGEWVYEQSGIEFPLDGLKVTESVNKRGETTFEVKMTYIGPLGLPRAERQRIKFDLTQDEVLADESVPRTVFHGYSDLPEQLPQVRCYSVTELLAEKTRALYERRGRARDVYDVVNVGRNLRDEIQVAHFRTVLEKKFSYKELEQPTTESILSRIDPEVLASDWSQSLRHQLPTLPPVKQQLESLAETLAWLLEGHTPVSLRPVQPGEAEAVHPRVRFNIPSAAIGSWRTGGSGYPVPDLWRQLGDSRLDAWRQLDRIRFAARNHLLVEITYKGRKRLVEPYSLRTPATGNLLLYGFEVRKEGRPTDDIRAYKVSELGGVRVTSMPFQPRFRIEL